MSGRVMGRMGVVLSALCALLGGGLAGPAGAQTILWTSQFGGTGSDFATAVVRGSGNVRYVVGFTTGTLPGQQSAGGFDAFVRKYGADGSVLWTRQFGTAGTDMALAVGLSVEDDGAADGVYVAGFVGGALPGQVSAGGNDAFVRKYNPAGDEIWTRQFGTSEHDEISGVGIDSDSQLIVAGSTLGSLAAPNAGTGTADVFLRKFTPAGAVVWTRQFGTDAGDVALGLTVKQDTIYVAGLTAGALPGQSSAGGVDAFVRRYDGKGTAKWTRQFGTPGFDEVWAVTIGPDGGVYVVGGTGGVLPNQQSAGGFDAFVRKYSPTGAVRWTRQFGTAGDDEAFNVAVGNDGFVYVAGVTGGAFPGLTSHGSFDGFIRKYSSTGVHKVTVQLGTDGYDEIDDLDVDVTGDVYVVGSTTGTFPGQTRAGAADEDAFVMKLKLPAK